MNVSEKVGEIYVTANRRVIESPELALLRQMALILLDIGHHEADKTPEVISAADLKKYREAKAIAQEWFVKHG